MSLSDYLKYLSAVKGGLTPWEIAEGSGVPSGAVHLIMVKHRRVGEDEQQLEKLAAFFGVPAEELAGRREAYRKRLTEFLDEAQREDSPVAFKMESGEQLTGRVLWYAREAVALAPEESGEGEGQTPCIVQRNWVADWRRSSSPTWEVASAPSAAS